MNKFGLPIFNNLEPSIAGNGERFIQFMFLTPNLDESILRYGKEKISKETESYIKLMGEYGSIRYLYQQDGKYIGSLQLVKKGEIVALSTIFVTKEFRNKGIGTFLVNQAKKDYDKKLVLSHSFTEQGAKFFRV